MKGNLFYTIGYFMKINIGSKNKGPFGTLGRDYKVVSTVFPPFSDCTVSHNTQFFFFKKSFTFL